MVRSLAPGGLSLSVIFARDFLCGRASLIESCTVASTTAAGLGDVRGSKLGVEAWCFVEMVGSDASCGWMQRYF
jgi:hypothetical protein